MDEKGLHNGIKAILLAPRTATPYWVENASMDKFMNLKMKLTTVTQAIEEIDRFVDEEMPDYNQIASEHKTAQKKADKLQTNLQSACNELSALTVIADESFGDEFFGSISAFVEETRNNGKARSKVSDMKSRLSNRGIVTHQTNIPHEQSYQSSMGSPHSRCWMPVILGRASSRARGYIGRSGET